MVSSGMRAGCCVLPANLFALADAPAHEFGKSMVESFPLQSEEPPHKCKLSPSCLTLRMLCRLRVWLLWHTQPIMRSLWQVLDLASLQLLGIFCSS